MTGPDINRPRPGSNAIGSFIIGVSPIGSIPLLDYWVTVISQYANSPRLDALIENINSSIDPTVNVDAFFDNMFNIDTATGYGLDVWGRILGVERTLSVAFDDEYLGMNEAQPGSFPFGQAPFFNGQQLTNNFDLTDSAYRVLLLAKALFNITDGSILSINTILLLLFPARGNCYVVDNLDMTMAYKFEFALTSVELAIVGQSDVLPRPSGVLASLDVPI